ncbi:putative mitotic cyclin [Leptomonas pyrrhocoris]|uniref:Putative mitotic cyclin n=1 Tax=Leptomonas pyrrhocoris TaxID=157538 RepID=A0A0N0VI84_LEPPY|nr:putative mitotic cyclin [Leptomonas pyrrhocoris]KPA86738.1 putative mitotic cyclin [Leptomonas pyrrhocoris]|eukprot:XP_015665177.1 putative mitotic cyclin [Leptomonas pyrrhocoris]
MSAASAFECSSGGGGKNTQPTRQVLGTLSLNQELPTQSITLDCSKAVLRLPAYVAAKLEAEKNGKKALAPLTFAMIQQRIRDYFVRDLDDATELAAAADDAPQQQQRYVLTSATVEKYLFPLFQRADAKAVRILGEVWGRSRDPSRRLSDQIVAVLTRRQHALLQGTELTLQELKERVLLTARLQESLTARELRQLAIQLGPNNRKWVEDWLATRPLEDVVDSMQLYLALRGVVQQRFGAFTFAGAYYPTVLDDLIEMDEQAHCTAVYTPKHGVQSQAVRARACEELFIFTIFCGIPISLDAYFLAVALLDRFLAVYPVEKEELRLYSMAALLLASKCDHSWPVLDPSFVSTKIKLAQDDVMTAEETLIRVLCFDTTAATLHHFCEGLLLHQDPPASPEQRRQLEYLIAALSLHTYFGQYRQSYLAAAALHSSRHAAGLPTGEPSDSVRVLLPVVHAALQKNNVERSPGYLLKQIYARPEYHSVSLTPPAALFPSLSCRSSLNASQ